MHAGGNQQAPTIQSKNAQYQWGLVGESSGIESKSAVSVRMPCSFHGVRTQESFDKAEDTVLYSQLATWK